MCTARDKNSVRDLRCDAGQLREAGRDRDRKILRAVGRNQGFDTERREKWV